MLRIFSSSNSPNIGDQFRTFLPTASLIFPKTQLPFCINGTDYFNCSGMHTTQNSITFSVDRLIDHDHSLRQFLRPVQSRALTVFHRTSKGFFWQPKACFSEFFCSLLVKADESWFVPGQISQPANQQFQSAKSSEACILVWSVNDHACGSRDTKLFVYQTSQFHHHYRW